jgi:hypothetical protein
VARAAPGFDHTLFPCESSISLPALVCSELSSRTSPDGLRSSWAYLAVDLVIVLQLRSARQDIFMVRTYKVKVSSCLKMSVADCEISFHFPDLDVDCRGIAGSFLHLHPGLPIASRRTSLAACNDRRILARPLCSAPSQSSAPGPVRLPAATMQLCGGSKTTQRKLVLLCVSRRPAGAGHD